MRRLLFPFATATALLTSAAAADTGVNFDAPLNTAPPPVSVAPFQAVAPIPTTDTFTTDAPLITVRPLKEKKDAAAKGHDCKSVIYNWHSAYMPRQKFALLQNIHAALGCILLNQDAGQSTRIYNAFYADTIINLKDTHQRVTAINNQNRQHPTGLHVTAPNGEIDEGFANNHITALINDKDWLIFQKHDGEDLLSRSVRRISQELEQLAPNAMERGRRAMQDYFRPLGSYACGNKAPLPAACTYSRL